ncbi:hypothetical protein C0992_012592 [Termitomyces sp. T32_za158]|nr:hypothetical protein C0992_012592 [Termitomyces sp. T32_za158]
MAPVSFWSVARVILGPGQIQAVPEASHVSTAHASPTVWLQALQRARGSPTVLVAPEGMQIVSLKGLRQDPSATLQSVRPARANMKDAQWCGYGEYVACQQSRVGGWTGCGERRGRGPGRRWWRYQEEGLWRWRACQRLWVPLISGLSCFRGRPFGVECLFAWVWMLLTLDYRLPRALGDFASGGAPIAEGGQGAAGGGAGGEAGAQQGVQAWDTLVCDCNASFEQWEVQDQKIERLCAQLAQEEAGRSAEPSTFVASSVAEVEELAWCQVPLTSGTSSKARPYARRNKVLDAVRRVLQDIRGFWVCGRWSGTYVDAPGQTK